MTTITDQNSLDFSQFQAHFCLVSDQAAANFLPIAHFKPKHVVLIVSPKMKEKADWLEAAIKKAAPGTRIRQIDIKEEPNENIFYWASEIEKLKEKRPVVNLTGGTKLMAFAAMRAANLAGCPAFYLDQFNSFITVFPSGESTEKVPSFSMEFKPKLQYYFASYGYDCTKDPEAAKPMKNEEKEFVRELVMKPELRNVVPMMNGLVAAAEGKNRTNGLKDMMDKMNPNLQESIRVWIRNFEDAGYLKKEGDELCFDGEEERFYVAGGWMEKYVAGCLSELGKRPFLNLEVKIGNVKNEFDVAFFDQNCPCIIECKTSQMQASKSANKTRQKQVNQFANDVVYKLETLRKTGGLNTKLFLVSYQEVAKQAKDRAKQSNIVVIDGERIKDLKAWIRKGLAV